jgi:hypothetical protein
LTLSAAHLLLQAVPKKLSNHLALAFRHQLVDHCRDKLGNVFLDIAIHGLVITRLEQGTADMMEEKGINRLCICRRHLPQERHKKVFQSSAPRQLSIRTSKLRYLQLLLDRQFLEQTANQLEFLLDAFPNCSLLGNCPLLVIGMRGIVTRACVTWDFHLRKLWDCVQKLHCCVDIACISTVMQGTRWFLDLNAFL